jgi:hypothetical protein
MCSTVNRSGSRLIIHIGLPKTGTTTLQQDVFPHFTGTYLGVFQPREEPQTDFYQSLFAAVSSEHPVESASELRSRLNSVGQFRTGSVGPMLLSEETITAGVNWREQLQRLSQIIDGTDYTILVTWRDPVDAAYSFYCEIYRLLRPLSVIEAIHSHEAMKIYRGDVLSSALEEAFEPSRVKLLRFDDLFLKGEGMTRKTLASAGVNLSDGFSIQARHVTQRTGSYVTKVEFNKPIEPIPIPNALKRLSGGRIARVVRITESKVRSRISQQEKQVLIPKLSDSERAEVSRYLYPYADCMDRFSCTDF